MIRTEKFAISLTIAASTIAAPSLAGAQVPTLRRQLTIGCESCEGPAQFSRVDGLAIADRGDVIVVDREAPFLRRFDVQGKAVWQGGAKGKGPGEYQSVDRVVFAPDGGLVIVDAAGMRITVLSASHTLLSTTPLERYATTIAANSVGTLLLGAESPRGAFTLDKWERGRMTKVEVPSIAPAAYYGASIAVSPRGALAVMPTNNNYSIIRFDARGARLSDITRDIERPSMTRAEQDAAAATSRRAASQVAEMIAARNSSKGGNAKPVGTPTSPMLKAHVSVDGLRYDSQGRLWVLTMRGNEARTVFDVFAESGVFLGSVTVEEQVKHFAVSGEWLLTASENADGIPIVTRWSMR